MEVKPVLARLLKERGMTQRELSEKTGIPEGTISRFDKNDRVVIKYMYLIADALDVSIADLFEVRK